MASSPGIQVVEKIEVPGEFWRLRDVFAGAPHFLLDSALPAGRLGRFSFVGGDPFAVVRVWRSRGGRPGANARVRIEHRRDVGRRPWGVDDVAEREGDAWALLRELLAAYRCIPPARSPVPFCAGAVGYLGYEAGHFTEVYGDTGADDLGLADVCLLFVDGVIAGDHTDGSVRVAAAGWGASESEAQDRAASRRRAIVESLVRFRAADRPVAAPTPTVEDEGVLVVDGASTAAGYAASIGEIRRHLLAGDAYEVCLTRRLGIDAAGIDPWTLYGHLREVNPAPFAGFLDLGEVTVVSSSPERFLALDREGRAESRPIKGTRPRGATPDEDAAQERSLASSEKERAENIMIVDLVRNDFGRVCRPGTVRVPELLAVERYRTVFQMVSSIVGELAADRDAVDLLRACFPGGSMTGAPKVAAMEIIDRLEPVTRGVYSGAIGYLDFSGPVDLSIVIRTFVFAAGRCTWGVGGAVIVDSDPAAEYDETVDKAVALHEALRRATGAERVGVRVPDPLV